MTNYARECTSGERIVGSAVDIWYETPTERFSIGCPQEILGIRCGVCGAAHAIDISCDDILREAALARFDPLLLAKIGRLRARHGDMRSTVAGQGVRARYDGRAAPAAVGLGCLGDYSGGQSGASRGMGSRIRSAPSIRQFLARLISLSLVFQSVTQAQDVRGSQATLDRHRTNL